MLALGEALNMARANGVDLVEIAPNANPPVCRLVDYGKFRYEQAKRDKESRKHQHATRVKEVQLSPKIDPHDLGVKIEHAVGFLCEDMKVKVTLKFRGREMQHTDVGFQVVHRFLNEISPYGHQDFEPKLIGRGINVILDLIGGSYLERNVDCLAKEGRLSVVATQGGRTGLLDVGKLMQKRARVLGSTMRVRTAEEKGEIAERLLREVWPLLPAKDPIRPVIDSTFPLADARLAHARMESSEHIGKIVLVT